MSRHGDVTFEWADGEYTFRLGIGEIRKLQERVDAGPFELLHRLTRHTWRIDDLLETIRLGLQGGGSVVTEKGAPDDAKMRRLVREYVEERPLTQSVLIAARILEAALSGAPDEKPPKSEAVESQEKSLSAESSPSPPSTAGDQSSATDHATSMTSPSGSSKPVARATRKRTRQKTSRNRQPEMNTSI